MAMVLCCGNATAETGKISIAYVNGITNTELQGYESLQALARRYISTAQKPSDIEYRLFYNKTQGFFDDTGELDVQDSVEAKARQLAISALKKTLRLQETDHVTVEDGSPNHLLYKAYLDAFLSDIIFEKKVRTQDVFNDWNVIGTDGDVANDDIAKTAISIAYQVLNELTLDNNTRRVVLVPHSQGNYYVQAVAALIRARAPDAAKRLSVMGVGAVSSIALERKEHVSLRQDRALALHASTNDYYLAGNFEGGWQLGATPSQDDRLQINPNDPKNHGFIETYMSSIVVMLPFDGINCGRTVVPVERFAEERESRRQYFGHVCQEKYKAANGNVVVGIGANFPELRGVKLAPYIVKKIEASIPPIVSEAVFSDEFNGSSLDTSKWKATGPVNAVSIAGGFSQFAASGRIDTQGKVVFSGNKIVIEARMAGQGGSRDTSIGFTDADSGDLVYSGDTNYFSRGFFAAASGAYNLTDAPRATDGSAFNVLALGGSTNQFMEYRWTFDGDKITIERGTTLSSITQNATRTLGRSIVGRKYYLSIGTAGPNYSPGTWDWVRVYTY